MKAKANIAAKLAAHSPLRRCALARHRRDPDWRFVSGVLAFVSFVDPLFGVQQCTMPW